MCSRLPHEMRRRNVALRFVAFKVRLLTTEAQYSKVPLAPLEALLCCALLRAKRGGRRFGLGPLRRRELVVPRAARLRGGDLRLDLRYVFRNRGVVVWKASPRLEFVVGYSQC